MWAGARCLRPAAGRQDAPCEVDFFFFFHSSLSISTLLLHVAIMRDKALSNEQLHVARSVPITNHCVWRKTFLCTNIPAHCCPGSASHPVRRGGKRGAVGWTPLLKRTSRCHAHPRLGQWRHSGRMLGPLASPHRLVLIGGPCPGHQSHAVTIPLCKQEARTGTTGVVNRATRLYANFFFLTIYMRQKKCAWL